ncbi:N-acetylmuramoyl-L-alanine amidase [Flavobacterium sp. SOK18b]|uniref:N-acetylmuramoyl-L-alanine amidase family protein n=1 Tax=Flavobacterium sp. SOK18b TaxID=797900 RepID=UPI0015FA22D8|nr:N-acetylmuramoyl-L-alanine amidase [Flavobacterium sp. SOK18b]MBB1193903.1 N-acetylmuramoyl-L-alanine amidase [Flavobacterium sp. SOK18b]
MASIAVFSQSKNKFIVILDAGHGGKDPGNSYHGFIEKEIALKTTLQLEKQLNEDPDIKVIHTRKSDVFIELKDRPHKANSLHADLFISIHCNSVNNPVPYGTETFVMGLTRSKGNLEIAKQENSVILLEKDYKRSYKGFDPKNPETLIGLKILQEDYLDRSIRLASKIEGNFIHKLNRKSRGIKQTPLWVLDAAYMPSVLIELGFLSNKNEGTYLNSAEGQKNMAQAIASAIIAYKKEYFDTSSSNDNDDLKEVSKTKSSSIDKKITVKAPLSDINSKPSKTNVVFKIQFASGNKKLDLKPQNFKGLKDVSVQSSSGSLFTYFFGEANTYAIAKENLKKVQLKGYTTAYIVAFQNGKNISIKEALKLL